MRQAPSHPPCFPARGRACRRRTYIKTSRLLHLFLGGPQVTADYCVICAGIYSQPYIPDYEVGWGTTGHKQ